MRTSGIGGTRFEEDTSGAMRGVDFDGLRRVEVVEGKGKGKADEVEDRNRD